jgi:hypothetical protein
MPVFIIVLAVAWALIFALVFAVQTLGVSGVSIG